MATTTLVRRNSGKARVTATPAIRRTICAIVEEAQRAVDGAFAILKALGVLDGLPGQNITIPLDLLLKLGALMRIYQWQEAGILQFLRAELPAAERVLRDVLENPNGNGQFDGHDLAQRVFHTWFCQFAFARVEPRAEVVIPQVDPHAVVAQLAEFLWRHRRLGPTVQEK